jgi:Protein of unknown function (DUF2442)
MKSKRTLQSRATPNLTVKRTSHGMPALAATPHRTTGVNDMLPRITAARYLQGYTVWLRFADGAEGEIDLRAELECEVFAPLREESYFKQASLHPELRTLVWPNGADFAPEFLRSVLRVAA